MWRFLYLCTERNDDGQIQHTRQLLAIHIFQNALRSFLQCVLHLLRSEMLFLYFQRYIASLSFRCRHFSMSTWWWARHLHLPIFLRNKQVLPFAFSQVGAHGRGWGRSFSRKAAKQRGGAWVWRENECVFGKLLDKEWCVAVGACEMCWCVAYARCGWKMWLNVWFVWFFLEGRCECKRIK